MINDDINRLEHMLDACEKVIQFTDNDSCITQYYHSRLY